jgi:hypothetical protein
MKKGNILIVKDDKLLILSDNSYYIVKGKGHVGDRIEFDVDSSLPMPSYLFAIAAIEDGNLDETMKFIQSEWFKK